MNLCSVSKAFFRRGVQRRRAPKTVLACASLKAALLSVDRPERKLTKFLNGSIISILIPDKVKPE